MAVFPVAAVALPLALAFGVASGAAAAAGLVTAIVAGIVIGGLSGAPYQISGPTGAMSAVLILLAATGHFNEAFARLDETHALILSMRGVPLIDTSGLQAMAHLLERVKHGGGILMLAGVHESARRMLERGGLAAAIGQENFFWSADQAIVAAERRGCAYCAED